MLSQFTIECTFEWNRDTVVQHEYDDYEIPSHSKLRIVSNQEFALAKSASQKLV